MAKAGTRQAVFFELHGVLLKPWTGREDYAQPALLDGALEALQRLDPEQMDFFIASNQCEVAMGTLRERDFRKMQDSLLEIFKEHRIPIRKIYTCLYHPKGKGKWKKESVFRKPNIGMFKMAEHEFDLNLRRSWVICESTSDILAGNRAGLGTVLVRTGKAGLDKTFDVEPHFTVDDVYAATDHIARYEASMLQ